MLSRRRDISQGIAVCKRAVSDMGKIHREVHSVQRSAVVERRCAYGTAPWYCYRCKCSAVAEGRLLNIGKRRNDSQGLQ